MTQATADKETCAFVFRSGVNIFSVVNIVQLLSEELRTQATNDEETCGIVFRFSGVNRGKYFFRGSVHCSEELRTQATPDK